MPSQIDNLVELFAQHLAHKKGLSVAELRPFVRGLFDQARREYLAAGAPLGSSDEAFLVWLEERQRVVKSKYYCPSRTPVLQSRSLHQRSEYGLPHTL
jgi:hypothetical protein